MNPRLVYCLQIGCLVKDFKPSDWMDGKDAKRQGRYTQFAMAATKLALEDSKLDTEAVDKVRCEVTKQDAKNKRHETETKRQSAQTRGYDWGGWDATTVDWIGPERLNDVLVLVRKCLPFSSVCIAVCIGI